MKELLFSIGALRAFGLSHEYATIIAERVLAPGAELNAGDREWLARIREAQRMLERGLSPRWASAN